MSAPCGRDDQARARTRPDAINLRQFERVPDPGNKMTVRELAKLARYIIQTYPEFYKLFNEREFTWNKIRNRTAIRC